MCNSSLLNRKHLTRHMDGEREFIVFPCIFNPDSHVYFGLLYSEHNSTVILGLKSALWEATVKAGEASASADFFTCGASFHQHIKLWRRSLNLWPSSF